ncbi:DNA-processing protein DprA [[Mycoplasma] anseris]|uniref:Smf/DprA SLOG domain-containing protein n=1 Tax=[Mycoplasma] anseris TaxID=92400 RepID=A0A2Z4NCG5_9BACT|nr:DNA-processing protein DprA [[Mycoplasma] anseris]AWX69250.1 hypothetical protein DP065_00560 [[Mycoplasma] anseris]
MNDYIYYFCRKYNGDWNKIYQAFKTYEWVDNELFKKYQDERQTAITKYFTILDADYPVAFLKMDFAPFIIFYHGNFGLLNDEKIICLTGNVLNHETLKLLEKIDEINEPTTFINLLWNGLDEYIVKRILKNPKLNLILIAPCGLNKFNNNFLTQQDLKRILILSEYPDDYHPTKKSFSFRNRIVNALAFKLVLFATNGNLMYPLIDYYIVNNKPINCFLSNESNKEDENINLINNGAKLIRNFNNIRDIK